MGPIPALAGKPSGQVQLDRDTTYRQYPRDMAPVPPPLDEGSQVAGGIPALAGNWGLSSFDLAESLRAIPAAARNTFFLLQEPSRLIPPQPDPEPDRDVRKRRAAKQLVQEADGGPSSQFGRRGHGRPSVYRST